jgi:hypothetical protein
MVAKGGGSGDDFMVDIYFLIVGVWVCLLVLVFVFVFGNGT